MSKPQRAPLLSSNNGTGVVSSPPANPAEPVKMVDPEIKKDAVPRLEDRIPPSFLPVDNRNISLRELLNLCLKEESEELWREFDKRTRPTIRGAVAKRLRACGINCTKELVEELTQDTFVKLLNHDRRPLRKEWEDDDSIFKYVKTVGHSAVGDWLRKNKILKDPDEFDERQELDAAPMVNPAEMEILRAQVDRCLQTLESDPNFKRNCSIFWFFFLHGYRDREIAGLVNLPIKTVQNILQKYVRVVRLKLRQDKGKGAPGE